MKRFMMLFVAAILGFALMGCEDGGVKSGVDVKNQSSHNVSMIPNGDSDWSAFVIGPGQERNIDVDHTIHFIYYPSTVVASTSEGTVIFTDR